MQAAAYLWGRSTERSNWDLVGGEHAATLRLGLDLGREVRDRDGVAVPPPEAGPQRYGVELGRVEDRCAAAQPSCNGSVDSSVSTGAATSQRFASSSLTGRSRQYQSRSRTPGLTPAPQVNCPPRPRQS